MVLSPFHKCPSDGKGSDGPSDNTGENVENSGIKLKLRRLVLVKHLWIIHGLRQSLDPYLCVQAKRQEFLGRQFVLRLFVRVRCRVTHVSVQARLSEPSHGVSELVSSPRDRSGSSDPPMGFSVRQTRPETSFSSTSVRLLHLRDP